MQEIANAPDLIMYQRDGNRTPITTDILERLVYDCHSWMRFAFTVLGGPPARMIVGKATDAGRRDVFVALGNRAAFNDSYSTLDARYPENTES